MVKAKKEYSFDNDGNNYQIVWTPPNVGWLNVDVGFNNHIKTTNQGWCVRAYYDKFIIACIVRDFGVYLIIEA